MKKNDVWEYFKMNQHRFISGEEMARHFSVTRASIWKHIKNLEKDGYKFEASTNKGYKIKNEILFSEEILKNLSPLKFSNIKCEVFEEINSTSTYAKSIENQKGLTIISANSQTMGRGRHGKEFFSPKGTGVYTSLLFSFENYFRHNLYTVTAAVAISNVIESLFGIETKIKWVNDIYFQKKKICGILTEGTYNFETGQMENIILGFGINITTQTFPEQIENVATSIGVKNANRNIVIAKIVNEFFTLMEKPKEEVINSYKKHSLLLGKEISFIQDGKTVTATATDINTDGNLICVSLGKSYTLTAGEISIIPTDL